MHAQGDSKDASAVTHCPAPLEHQNEHTQQHEDNLPDWPMTGDDLPDWPTGSTDTSAHAMMDDNDGRLSPRSLAVCVVAVPHLTVRTCTTRIKPQLCTSPTTRTSIAATATAVPHATVRTCTSHTPPLFCSQPRLQASPSMLLQCLTLRSGLTPPAPAHGTSQAQPRLPLGSRKQALRPSWIGC